jgi:hypothetical protein
MNHEKSLKQKTSVTLSLLLTLGPPAPFSNASSRHCFRKPFTHTVPYSSVHYARSISSIYSLILVYTNILLGLVYELSNEHTNFPYRLFIVFSHKPHFAFSESVLQ